MLGGALLAITRQALIAVLPAQVSNGWATLFQELSPGGQVTIFSILALAMSIFVQFSGLSVFVGGVLCFKEHVRSGKELVGLGTTVGFADLLLLIPALASSQQGPPLWLAWVGLAFSVFADRHIKGPQASYAGELRKLLGALRSRAHARERKKHLRRRRRRVRVAEGTYSGRH
jgi:hypothetical protein